MRRLPSPPARTIARTFGPPLRYAMGATLLVAHPRREATIPPRVLFVRIDILSKEYPPAIYGGAGVHVAELVRALRRRGDLDVRVHAFGEPRDEDGTTGHPDLAELTGANAAL